MTTAVKLSVVCFHDPVLGPVDPSDLGLTLTHEHLLVDFRKGFLPPPPGNDDSLSDLRLSMENLGAIRRFPCVSPLVVVSWA